MMSGMILAWGRIFTRDDMRPKACGAAAVATMCLP